MHWLRAFFRGSAVEREMDAEIRFHYEQLVEDLIQQGAAAPEARRRARLQFGGLTQVKDDAREARLADRLEQLLRVFRMAARSLRKSPGFTAIAVATLALGIGANTVMFSLLDQIVMRDLPVKDPERLVIFHSLGVSPGMERNEGRKLSFSYPKYRDFRDRCPVFSGVAARFAATGSLRYQGATEKIYAELVTGNYFDVLGVAPAIGRVFTAADDREPMAHPVVVLGHAYWQRHFGGDRSIVGQKVTVNGMPMTVIGVSAPGFHSLDRGNEEDLRLPMMMKDLFTPAWRGLDRRFWAWLNIVARVKPGISIPQAESGANVFYRQVLEGEAKQLPGTYLERDEFVKRHLDLLPAAAGMMDQIGAQKNFLLELMAITGIVLLIACVNLAGLLMARTATRQRELAIRLALGAGRWGVIRQLLAENLLIAGAGGTLGVLFAMVSSEPAAQFLISPDAAQLLKTTADLRVLLFALGVTTLTTIAFALAPVLQMRRAELADILKSESGASSSRAQVRLRKFMVVAQLAFCVWLTIAAGLFARSLAQLRGVSLGFRSDHLITFRLDPNLAGYQSEQSRAAYRRVTDALSAAPGVISVADSDYGVFTGNVNVMRLAIEGYRPHRPSDTEVRELVVTSGYFRAMGMELIAGRDFTPADMQSSARKAIVNDAFAKRYCDGQNPVGRHFGWAGQKGSAFEIVGMVNNQRYDGPAAAGTPFYYLPVENDGAVSFYVRTAPLPESMLATVRRIVNEKAPGVPIDRLQTMDQFVELTLGSKTRIAGLATFFGLIATLLAAMGLYGVMAYTVARRTREIGIRLALGAGSSNVLFMVIREVGTVIAGGLGIGVPTGMTLALLIRSQLYGVSPMNPGVIAMGATVVAGMALLAGLLPARRATRIDPMRALRWE